MTVRADSGAAVATQRNDDDSVLLAQPPGLNALAVEALAQEPRAVRRFLQAIAPGIRRTCCGAMGPGHADLEDTIQEALVDTMRALPRYRFEGDVIHYVTKIALRLAIEARRRGTVRSGRLQAFGEQQTQALTGDSEGRRFEHTELARQALQNMKPALAEVLVLHLVLGFSVDEVAAITQTRANTVRKRLRLGRISIKTNLAELDKIPTARKGAHP